MEELEEEMGEEYRTGSSLTGHSAKSISKMKLEKEQKHSIQDTSSDVSSELQEPEKEVKEQTDAIPWDVAQSLKNTFLYRPYSD